MSPQTLFDLPTELILEIASHLDPLVASDVRGVAALYVMGLLVSADEFEELYTRRRGRFPWDWLPGWLDHFSATFIHGNGHPFSLWLEKMMGHASKTGQNDLIDRLARHGVRPTVEHLIDAASAGSMHTFDHLVERYGLDPHGVSPTGSWCPLYAACLFGQDTTIKHLISTYHVDYKSRTSTGAFLTLQLAARWPRCTALLQAYLDADDERRA